MAENHTLEAAAEARSPNTSPARLAELMRHWGELVLQNPSWPLVLLEHPDIWATLPAPASLADAVYCPLDFAQWVLAQPHRDEGTCHSLALNPAVPVALRREAFHHVSFRARWRLELWRLVDLLTPEEVALLERAGVETMDPPEVHPVLTDAEFEQLAALGPTGDALAWEHPRCPQAVLEVLAERPPEYLKDWPLPKHSHLSPGRLAGFLTSSDLELRDQALLNPSMTAEQFRTAMQAADTCAIVMRNPSLPVEQMLVLANDPHPLVRRSLALRRALPAEVQRLLAADPWAGVHVALRRNPSLLPEIRALLP